MYYLRSDKGILVAKISSSAANNMMLGVSGHHTTKRFVNNTTKNVFVIDEDTMFGVQDQFSVYLWKGYYLSAKA